MRTFVAFTLPDDAVNQIIAWQQANLPAGVFPEPPTNLHMTLAFLGDTPDQLVPEINKILAELNASSVSISGPIEYREQDKLAFLTFQEQGGTAVWETLNGALRELIGYEPQFKPWLPHTTVWRFAPDHKPNINPPLPSMTFVPTAVTLYQSVKNPAGGASYQKVGSKIGNIFDPIEPTLDQRVYNGIKPKPTIASFIENTFYEAMEDLYVDDPKQYFDLALTGSLTTYQYSDTSDCDISVFVHYDDLMDKFDTDDPVDIRKRLISIVTTELDGTYLPGTQHPLQFFIIPPGNNVHDYFRSGMRSGWSFNERGWIVPPEKKRSHDIATEMPELYSRAAAMANKMSTLLDAGDVNAARQFFAEIHKKRNADEAAGLGDFSEGNIMYKYLLHEGLFDRLRNEAGVHIAKVAAPIYNIDKGHINKDNKIPVLYDFDRDRIIMSNNFDFHRGSKIIGEYDGKDVFLHGTSKQWINPNYFKRLWLASFPQRVLDKVHIDGKAVETRPADEMTYTQKLPWLVQSSDPWRKGKDWKDFIKNEGIIVDFQVGDEKDDPVEGRVKEIHGDSIRIEVKPGEYRTFDDDFLKQIKFRVRDDKRSLSSVWKESFVVSSDVGDCLTPDCDYEYNSSDNADITLANGWFTCPQCNHTHYVRTSELKHKTSNVI